MKKTSFLYGALGLMTLGLAACNSDVPEMTGNGVAQNDEVRYLRVAIANPATSRAAEFENGTAEENAVGELYFRFYDAAGNPIESGTTQLENVEFDDVTPANGNVGKVKEVVLQLTLPRGSAYPSYVVCFINPVNYDEISNKSGNMSSLRDEFRSAFLDNAKNFAMNNSVYYGNDPISGAGNVKMFGAPILTGQLFTSETDALAATGEDIVSIYVERYAAKVRLTIADEAVKPVTVGDYTLTFVPEVWTVNADAPTMYASKRFEDTNAASTTIPTYNQVQTMLGGWTTWNDAANHRSYWACSPSYYATEFPQVSDDIIDIAPTGTTGAGVALAPFALRYYSYNQIKATTGPGAGVTAFNNGGTNWKYTMENTVGRQAFQSANPKAAVPSVLIVGHYDLTTGGNTTALTTGDGFCIYNGKIYFRNNVPANAAAGATTMLTEFLNQNKVLAINEDGTLLNYANSAAVRSAFVVAHPAKDVRDIQPIPHRYVTLQLTSVPATGLYYKPAGSDTWKQATVDDLTYINTLLWQQLGNASSYTQGKCYFSLPIQHLGISENDINTNPIDADGVLDWTKVRVGDFGLVRNHVYSLGVSEISGRATGIEDLDNPLVPSVDETNYWIKYQINILNWRLVPEQNNIVL